MSTLAALLMLAHSPRFVEVGPELGLSIGNDQACWADLDRDGWTDLVAGGVVWRNENGKRFSKLFEGVGQVVAADFDNDGYNDLFSWSAKKLWRNLKGKSFQAVQLPELPAGTSRGAVWGDFDNDGFVDLYVGGFEDWERQIAFPSFVLMNRKGVKFEVTRVAADFRTRGVTACDVDRDGNLDVYASNYRLQPNQLWLGDGKGGFKDGATERNALATSPGFAGGHSIGAAWGDFDNDGEIDLFAGNFAHVDSRGDQPKSRFLRNLGRSQGYRFEDKGPCGVAYQESYASPAAGDVDNDGKLDLFFTTVYGTASFGRPNFPVLMRNLGSYQFGDETAALGLEKLAPTYQASFADFRNQGSLGLCSAGKVFAQPANGNWIGIRLEGDGRKVNRSAIGAQVRIKTKAGTLVRQVEAGTGEGNQNDLRLHFGLGEHRTSVDLEISWPGGRRQVVRRAQVNRIVSVKFR